MTFQEKLGAGILGKRRRFIVHCKIPFEASCRDGRTGVCRRTTVPARYVLYDGEYELRYMHVELSKKNIPVFGPVGIRTGSRIRSSDGMKVGLRELSDSSHRKDR